MMTVGVRGGTSSLSATPMRGHAERAAIASAVAGLVWYVIADPRAPDLAAQVARSTVARGSGVTEWWIGWFGGLQLPSYSLLAPVIIAAVGTVVAASAATLLSVAAMTSLMRDTARPVAGSVAFAVMAVADVAAGRLTFALSVAVALWCLVAVRRRRWLAVPLAVVCALFSLLGGFFLGVAAIAVVITDRHLRRVAGTIAGSLLLVGIAEQVLFPQTGTMPFAVYDILRASAMSLVVAVLVPHRTVRAGALLMTVLPLLTMLDPGALGENVVRLDWLVAAPVVIACAATPRRWLVVAAAVATAVWPLSNTAHQLVSGTDPSAQMSFYQPLVQALSSSVHSAGTSAVGERVEVLPTRTHWEMTYLVGQFQLARGWDRQADVADNPLFYSPELNTDRYRSWLAQMSVGWVARPNATLDGAGLAEAALVDAGQPYLHLVWHNADWDLYQVTPATPLANGAQTTAVTPTSVTLHFARAGKATVQLRWTPYLVAEPAAATSGTACAKPSGSFTAITASSAGDYILSAEFSLLPSPCQGDTY